MKRLVEAVFKNTPYPSLVEKWPKEKRERLTTKLNKALEPLSAEAQKEVLSMLEKLPAEKDWDTLLTFLGLLSPKPGLMRYYLEVAKQYQLPPATDSFTNAWAHSHTLHKDPWNINLLNEMEKTPIAIVVSGLYSRWVPFGQVWQHIKERTPEDYWMLAQIFPFFQHMPDFPSYWTTLEKMKTFTLSSNPHYSHHLAHYYTALSQLQENEQLKSLIAHIHDQGANHITFEDNYAKEFIPPNYWP
ncbi:MAG: hypothetical protein GXN92_00460 [Candidatus Micrarchaeota archaeon]|nr:hypothetical protein [Candidatus Micrarchaeota archaeon]